jgi:hypothetical protein
MWRAKDTALEQFITPSLRLRARDAQLVLSRAERQGSGGAEFEIAGAALLDTQDSSTRQPYGGAPSRIIKNRWARDFPKWSPSRECRESFLARHNWRAQLKK